MTRGCALLVRRRPLQRRSGRPSPLGTCRYNLNRDQACSGSSCRALIDRQRHQRSGPGAQPHKELRRGDDRRSDAHQAKEVHVTRDERFDSGYAYKHDEELVVWVLDPLSTRRGRVLDLVGYAPEVAHEALGLLPCKPAAELARASTSSSSSTSKGETTGSHLRSSASLSNWPRPHPA